jgi:hypothetical protein
LPPAAGGGAAAAAIGSFLSFSCSAFCFSSRALALASAACVGHRCSQPDTSSSSGHTCAAGCSSPHQHGGDGQVPSGQRACGW